MKSFISILLSVIIFGASFQNSLYFIDYQINKDYYEALCINKQKPELDCYGKCQVKKEAQKEDSPISNIKYSFEVNILPVKSTEFIIKKPLFFVDKTKIVSINHNFTLDGYLKNGLQPPEILG
jgi:hypothetical protein